MPAAVIAIPVYNPSPAHLEACLRSVLAQEGDPRILLSDDGSTSLDVAALAQTLGGGRVQVHRQERNLGMVANWNWCLHNADGDWINLFHQDDVMGPGYVRDVLDIAQRHASVGMQFSEVDTLGPNGEVDRGPNHFDTDLPKGELLPGSLIAQRLFARGGNHICCPSVFVRRDAYRRESAFSHRPRFTTDLDMWLRLLLRPGMQVWIHAGRRVGYRYHPAQETSRFAPYSAECCLIEFGKRARQFGWGQRARLIRRFARADFGRLLHAWRHC